MTEQLDLFTTNGCANCETCTCANQSITDIMLDNIINDATNSDEKKQLHKTYIQQAIARDEVRKLCFNLAEVLSTYARIKDDDKNIFITKPTIEEDVASELYKRLGFVYKILSELNKKQDNTTL